MGVMGGIEEEVRLVKGRKKGENKNRKKLCSHLIPARPHHPAFPHRAPAPPRSVHPSSRQLFARRPTIVLHFSQSEAANRSVSPSVVMAAALRVSTEVPDCKHQLHQFPLYHISHRPPTSHFVLISPVHASLFTPAKIPAFTAYLAPQWRLHVSLTAPPGPPDPPFLPSRKPPSLTVCLAGP